MMRPLKRRKLDVEGSYSDLIENIEENVGGLKKKRPFVVNENLRVNALENNGVLGISNINNVLLCFGNSTENDFSWKRKMPSSELIKLAQIPSTNKLNNHRNFTIDIYFRERFAQLILPQDEINQNKTIDSTDAMLMSQEDNSKTSLIQHLITQIHSYFPETRSHQTLNCKSKNALYNLELYWMEPKTFKKMSLIENDQHLLDLMEHFKSYRDADISKRKHDQNRNNLMICVDLQSNQ